MNECFLFNKLILEFCCKIKPNWFFKFEVLVWFLFPFLLWRLGSSELKLLLSVATKLAYLFPVFFWWGVGNLIFFFTIVVAFFKPSKLLLKSKQCIINKINIITFIVKMNFQGFPLREWCILREVNSVKYGHEWWPNKL